MITVVTVGAALACLVQRNAYGAIELDVTEELERITRRVVESAAGFALVESGRANRRIAGLVAHLRLALVVVGAGVAEMQRQVRADALGLEPAKSTVALVVVRAGLPERERQRAAEAHNAIFANTLEIRIAQSAVILTRDAVIGAQTISANRIDFALVRAGALAVHRARRGVGHAIAVAALLILSGRTEATDSHRVRACKRIEIAKAGRAFLMSGTSFADRELLLTDVRNHVCLSLVLRASQTFDAVLVVGARQTFSAFFVTASDDAM